MKVIFNYIRNKKITTFLIVGIVLLIFSIIMFFYYLPRPGGESMASFGYILYFFISIIMLFVDRLLVQFIKPKRLSLFELLVIIGFILIIYILHEIQ